MQELTNDQKEIVTFRCTCIDKILNLRITKGMANVPKHFNFYKEISGKYFGKQLYDVVENVLEEMSVILGKQYKTLIGCDVDKEIIDVYKKWTKR